MKKLREKVISGETDSNKIREEWDKLCRTLYPKKRSNGSEKSEMNEAKKELNERKQNHEDIKERLQEIKDIMREQNILVCGLHLEMY